MSMLLPHVDDSDNNGNTDAFLLQQLALRLLKDNGIDVDSIVMEIMNPGQPPGPHPASNEIAEALRPYGFNSVSYLTRHRAITNIYSYTSHCP